MYRVLLVDDEKAICNGLKSFVEWEACGFEVAALAYSVAQALVVMEEQEIHLVVTDISMPVQSGMDLLAVLRKEYPAVRAIILSAYSDFGYAQQALRLNAVDYLTKPVDFEEMQVLLTRLKRRLDEELHREEEYTALRRGILLNNLVRGRRAALSAGEAVLCGLPPVAASYSVVRVLFVGGAPAGPPPQPREKARQALAAALAAAGLEGCVFQNEENELAALVGHAPGGPAPEWEPLLAKAAGGLGAAAGDVLVGVGACCASPVGSYTQAGRAMALGALPQHRGRPVVLGEITGGEVDAAEAMLAEATAGVLANKCLPAEAEGYLAALCAAAGGQDQARLFAMRLATALHDMLYERLPDSQERCAFRACVEALAAAPTGQELLAGVGEYILFLAAHGRLEDAAAGGCIVQKMKRYIDLHFAERINLQTLAEHFYLHPIYLSRLFKEKAGVNFSAYLLDVRMSRAKSLLATTSLRVGEVAEMVGYDNPRYFSKIFKATWGVTPGAYREARQEGAGS